MIRATSVVGDVTEADELCKLADSQAIGGETGGEGELAIVEIARATVGEIDRGLAGGDERTTAEIIVDESEEYEATPVSHSASAALASWDRTFAKLENPEFKVPKYMEAATEVLRLAKFEGGDLRQRQQLIDDLYEMGKRHGISAKDVETHMAAITRGMAPRYGAQDSVARTSQPAPVGSLADYGLSAEAGSNFDPPRADAPSPLRLICPPDWRDVPLLPMRWLATHRIPAADVTILSGDGGGGKTTVALQLAVAVEQGLGDWLGTVTESGPVIFFSAEEPDHEMRRRLQRVARKRGIVPEDIADLHFHFASPENCLLAVARADGTMWPTPLFSALAFTAATVRPVLIVVDSIAATFGGNQNDRVHARTFVSLFRRLAQDVDCAVLMLDHPSLSGITSGTGRGGSMDWQNATRARLHLETVQGADGITGRVLEVKKSNYGPIGDKVSLQWEDGSFVVEGSEAGRASPHRAAAQQGLDDLFVRLLEERNAQGRWVTPSKAAGYAPKELAAMQGAAGATAVGLARAMERLLAAKRIMVETGGPPSKQRQRLVVPLPTTLPTDN